MIQINQIKIEIPHTEKKILEKIAKTLQVREQDILFYKILKRALDARKKPQLFYVYNVDVNITNETSLKKKLKKPNSNIIFHEPKHGYTWTVSGEKPMNHRPVVIGTGPAGLFCGYHLARMGYRPILLERGAMVEERIKDVDQFWNGGPLNLNSNVQFGEGGAGTFSDGKLNTLVNDKSGRNTEVLRIFTEYGAPECICYDSKPHIGTDILAVVVENIRNAIIKLGGDVQFHSQVTDFNIKEDNGKTFVTGIQITDTLTGEFRTLDADTVVLAIGHSARDTFETLISHKVNMEAKAFAVGVRMEHPQEMINESQYGKHAPDGLPAAPYKLAETLENGHGVYTFCMCPGGYVVNASSEDGRLAVNGMSYSKRDGKYSNTAVIVTVNPEQFGTTGILSGMEFQRRLEEAAYQEGQGNIPVQLFGDFCKNIPSDGPGEIIPQLKGRYTWANVRNIFPEFLAESLQEGIYKFDRKIKGYAREDAVISGVESRTSSPVRILRDETFQSNIIGIYPCGEGAGYAGGITSAAMDGLKVAESVSRIYKPFDMPDRH